MVTNETAAPLYERVSAALECAHERKQVRLRVLSNQTERICEQCLTCGKELRALPKRQFSPAELSQMPAWDAGLADAWHQRWRDTYQQIATQQRAQEHEAWWASYDAYLHSPEWAARRKRVLERDQWRCRAELAVCTGRATTVHHLNYTHRGNEPLFDLVAVCRACHDALHEKDDDAQDEALLRAASVTWPKGDE